MFDRIRWALAALFAPLVFGLVLPLNISLRNLHELPFTPAAGALFLAFFLVLAAVSCAAHGYAARNGWARRTAKGLTGFAVTMLLWDALSVPAEAFGIAKWPWGLLELALLAGVVWVLRKTRIETMVRVMAAVTSVFLVFAALDAYALHSAAGGARDNGRMGAHDSPPLQAPPPGATAPRPPGNVYHLVLDQYQSEAFAYARQSDPEIAALPLTYFPGFRSNAHYTELSNAILIAGRLYDGQGPLTRWMERAYGAGLFAELAENQVGVHLFPYYTYYCHPRAVICRSAIDMAKAGVNRTAVLVDLWFLRILPRAFFHQPESTDVWTYEVSLSSWFTGTSPVDFFKTYARYSVSQFRELIRTEPARPARGQYVFAHVMLPHDPFVLDGECRERERQGLPANLFGERDPDQYLDHVRCVNRLLAEFVAELRRLNRLDDALLIVQSDHGRYFRPGEAGTLNAFLPAEGRPAEKSAFNHREASSDQWADIHIELRSSALLCIKAPGQQAGSESNLPLQTIDIAPTVLHHFGLPVGALPGRALQTLPAGWSREQEFMVYKRSGKGWLSAMLNVRLGEASLYRKRDGRWGLVRRFDEPADDAENRPGAWRVPGETSPGGGPTPHGMTAPAFRIEEPARESRSVTADGVERRRSGAFPALSSAMVR